ncbi:MAG: methyltransferase domain-containing protein [Elusimicrobiota bacterium]
MRLLNLACGDRFHKDWINIDFHSNSSSVIRVNILKGLDFESNTFDAVYTSHFLEHLPKNKAVFVLKEIYRVLKPGGILRVVVPDLENIAREYLKILENINNEDYKERYEWIILELLDQMVRNKPGGEMIDIYNNVKKEKNLVLARYIQDRVGERLLENNFKKDLMNFSFDKVKNKILYLYLKLIKYLIPSDIRDLIFVNTSIGEKHCWMYDTYSLSKILTECGYLDIKRMAYNQSQIQNFNSYFLDSDTNGFPYKGCSSLYIEGRK